MTFSEFRKINVPARATIRVTRAGGTRAIYVFHGTDSQGGIFEDENGQRHRDVGEYVELDIKTDKGWAAV